MKVDVDLGLVRRLEATAATASLHLIDAIKRLDTSTVADGRRFLDGVLIAMGPGRYVNRAIGVTINELSDADVDSIERFFVERNLPPMIELSSWAPKSTLTELARRNYVPAWFRSVFALRPDFRATAPKSEVRIERVVDGIAWLGGAATIPNFRQRGVQAALVAHRLRLAAELGCELAAVTALSNGPSARNIVRLGFQHIHAQAVVEPRPASGGHVGG